MAVQMQYRPRIAEAMRACKLEGMGAVLIEGPFLPDGPYQSVNKASTETSMTLSLWVCSITASVNPDFEKM